MLVGSFWSFSVYDFGVKQKFLFPFAERLKLAILAGTASLVVIFAIGYFVQTLRLSRGEDLAGALLFWMKLFVGPLAGATLLGVLLSRGRNTPSVSRLRTILIVAVAPLIAFCTFLVAYLIFTALYGGHYTPLVGASLLAVAYSTAVVSVRWFINFFYDPKQEMPKGTN